MRGLFVTGTDTGVGKTEVACALLAEARARGVDAVGMKPAQSGVTAGEPSDAERLRRACGEIEPLDAICPYSFSAPLAPAVAAREAGRTISFTRVIEAARGLGARHAAVLVEGAGGLLVPLTDLETYADLATALALPVLVVARAGLGTVNHTALTVEALRRRGLAVAAIVLNHTTSGDDASVPHNGSEIARLTGIAPAATLAFRGERETRERAMRAALAAAGIRL